MATSDYQISNMVVDEWQVVNQSSRASPANTDETINEDEWVVIIDENGRKWRALLIDCLSVESTKAMIAKELGIFNAILSINDALVLGSLWKSKVKSGVEIRIVNTQSIPPTPTYPAQPRSSGIPMLNFPTQDLYEAKGVFRLPFFGCTDRVYEFIGVQPGLAELEIYCKLRQTAPPERWSNLRGEVSTHGTISGLELPDVMLGRIIAGRLSQLKLAKRCWFIMVWKARIHVPKGETSRNLDGDIVYKWMRYASGDRARSNLQEAFGHGYGVVASWAEIEIEDGALVTFIGRKITESFFAVVGAKA